MIQATPEKNKVFVSRIMCITEPASTVMINPPTPKGMKNVSSLIGERFSIACKLWSC